MTLSELKRRYKHGASVKVLAELNALPPSEIQYALGIKKNKNQDNKNALFLPLWQQGKNDYEIAEITGYSQPVVYQWRKASGRAPTGNIRRGKK